MKLKKVILAFSLILGITGCGVETIDSAQQELRENEVINCIIEEVKDLDNLGTSYTYSIRKCVVVDTEGRDIHTWIVEFMATGQEYTVYMVTYNNGEFECWEVN